MVRHFLDISDFSRSTLQGIIDDSIRRKATAKASRLAPGPLAGKTLAMIFENPSTRTRISFDLAMRALGGDTIMLTGAEMQLGRGETIGDTARVLSRYVDAIMIRTLEASKVEELAANATIPVINGLTRRSHPCQVLADLMTMIEKRGPMDGKTVAWTGSSSNVLISWIHAAPRFGFRLKIATPAEYAPDPSFLDWARREGGEVELGDDPEAAVRGVDCVVTDTWVSMGDTDGERRHNVLKPYQVSTRLMALADEDALFMHCLPAHRGDEVEGAVIDGPQSVVWDEAENRLHVQKGILAWCFAGAEA
ncbi:MAG: ornithine carbamoyltransferase [Bauldia sp.]